MIGRRRSRDDGNAGSNGLLDCRCPDRRRATLDQNPFSGRSDIFRGGQRQSQMIRKIQTGTSRENRKWQDRRLREAEKIRDLGHQYFRHRGI